VIIHEKDHSMEIIVPDDQLSLAIGRRGQNVRLAAQLTGWNIDIYNETRHDEMTKRAKNALVLDLGIEESLSSIFYSHAFRTTKDIAETVLEEFLTLPGINSDRLKEIHQRAKEVMDLPVVERPSEIFAKQEGERLAAEQKKKEKEEKEEAEKRAAEEATAAENGESTAEGAEPVAENEEEKISEDAESSSTESPVEESSSKEIAE
jgi:N utilization substance protein A